MLRPLTTSAVLLLSAPLAHAQFQLDWCTIDGGGGNSAGGSFTLSATIGQPDAGSMAGGTLVLGAGFWFGAVAPGACYPNCDASTAPPILNANDFQCFINKFAAADTYANCDGSTAPPTLNTNDFQCFLNAFAAGCS